MGGTTARILIVDDDAKLCDVIRRQLSTAGHEALTASDGREALRLLATTRVDVVLTDLYMPEMDGIELVTWLSREAPGAPIIAMSGGGYVSRDDVLELATRLGAARVLAKPFTREQLLEAVGDAAPKGENG